MVVNFKGCILIHIWQVFSCDCMEGKNSTDLWKIFKKIKKILAFALPATALCNVADAVERVFSSPTLK